jgi:CDP-glycerol glycerophosphotransferase (TagB/SpsB family)
VDTVDKLRSCSVKTATIQHGGTRADSVHELSSAASDSILVWGKRVERDLLRYGVAPDRIKVVGNPLHDRFKHLHREQALQTFKQLYPNMQHQLETKKVVLLATCLHSEYRGRDQEQQLYQTYLQHIYQSLDFDKVLLLIKMHPLDKKEPNPYQTAISDPKVLESTIIIGADVAELDIYQLLILSDVLLTRASTVGEESLILGKKVIAFDLFPDGPSAGYQHLSEYGSHTTVYAEPPERLREAIEQALLLPPVDTQNQANIVADLTCALDGQSTQRALGVLLEQVSMG